MPPSGSDKIRPMILAVSGDPALQSIPPAATWHRDIGVHRRHRRFAIAGIGALP
jgi:hypothetical protein